MTPEEYKKLLSRSIVEDTEQIHLMRWCVFMETRWPELKTIYHIPNEGKRGISNGAKLKEMGMKPGMPDICLPVPRCGFAALYIEMKRVGRKPSKNQLERIKDLIDAGNCCAICEGADAAIEVITAYMGRHTERLHELICSERE